MINSVFEKSSKNVNQCPDNKLVEFALVGRSNVGKSSLINSLLNNKSIAKTSSKPGKTILINHFRINDTFYIVDLPGYGYATISKKIKKDIKVIHKNYFKSRKKLLYTFLLLDIRHEIQKREKENQKELNSKTDIGWGHQIRSYVLQPYQLVKDLRNKIEHTNPSDVLDGNIDLFIEAGIMKK